MRLGAITCHWIRGNPTWYVSHLPGEGGVDWGWDDRPSHAKPLSPYWQRRFCADMAYVGTRARLLPASRLGAGEQ